MFLASVIISGRDWLIPGAIFLLFSIALLVWSYRGTSGSSGGRRLVCFTLKLVGVIALAACLLEPLWSHERARPGSNYFGILADNSQGMKIRDRNATRSRGEELADLLSAAKPAWQPVLDETFQVRRYLFDAKLRSSRDFSDLIFDGRVSSMVSSLRTLADRYKGQPLAGVLLLTDGNATDLTEGLPDLTGLPPIYPVVMGTDDDIQDIALQRVTTSQTAFEDAPVTVQAEAMATGYAGETVVARLIKVTRPPALAATGSTAAGRSASTHRAGATGSPAGASSAAAHGAGSTAPGGVEKLVAEQRQRVSKDNDTVSFRFQVKPEEPGLSFYRVEVAPGSEAATPGRSGEATLANNHRVLVVDRGRGPYRILYVSGRPNWEYKFLQRAILADEQLQLVGLLRIARREPKFEFRGRAGESSNPLFRGFGNQSKEEIERYDQPVLIRLNTKDEFELRGGFPKLPEDLYGYHAILVDDLESEFFTPDQLTLLQKFVSERGGGFMMLGGMESLQEGKFQRTPVGDMLPVYLDQPGENPSAGRLPGELRLSLTREGLLQPWARLRNNEADEAQRLRDVPPFGVLNHVRGIKPGAIPIANVTDGNNPPQPALVAQRYGNGRSAALLLGDVWHWGLKDEANHKDMDKAWRQIMRWLVSDVPQRTELVAQAVPGDANQAIRLMVRVRDPKFQPLDNASVSIVITPVGTDSSGESADTAAAVPATAGTATAKGMTNRPAASQVRLTAEPSLSEPGVYEATYIPRNTGGYQAEALVQDNTGLEVGRAEAGWTSDPAADEFRSLKPNRALLETIAKRTGGEVIPAARLEAFAKGLPNRKAPVTENWTSPLWHQAGVFLFALACFIAEWGLRRSRGLA